MFPYKIIYHLVDKAPAISFSLPDEFLSFENTVASNLYPGCHEHRTKKMF